MLQTSVAPSSYFPAWDKNSPPGGFSHHCQFLSTAPPTPSPDQADDGAPSEAYFLAATAASPAKDKAALFDWTIWLLIFHIRSKARRGSVSKNSKDIWPKVETEVSGYMSGILQIQTYESEEGEPAERPGTSSLKEISSDLGEIGFEPPSMNAENIQFFF